jgi:putative redox protein
MPENGLVTVRSNHAFTDTVRRLEAALDGRGLIVFARIDHAAGARAGGLDLPPTLLIIFGSARAGTPAMQAARTAGLDLPLKALVWQDAQGTAWLTYSEPAWTLARHGAGDSPAIGRLDTAMQELAAETTGAAKTSELLAGVAACHDRGKGKLQAQVAVGGVSFPADEPIEAGGGATGPSPHDLLAAGLAACTTLTVRLYADHKDWPVERIHVAVEHVREEGATPQDLFRRQVQFVGPLDDAQRERLVQIAERCPVHRTLTAGSRIETTAAAAAR